MTLSIAKKLVAAFLGLTLLVLVATLGLARWSFEQGFLDYVNALEQTRLERVQLDLTEEYLAAGGNWKALTGQRFAALMRRSAPRELQGSPPPGSMPTPRMREPDSQRRGPQPPPSDSSIRHGR